MRSKYLGSSVGLEAGVEGELESRDQLLVVNSGVQAGGKLVLCTFYAQIKCQLPVVGGPLLSDADSVLLDLVLGLKGTSDLRESMPNLLNHQVFFRVLKTCKIQKILRPFLHQLWCCLQQ